MSEGGALSSILGCSHFFFEKKKKWLAFANVMPQVGGSGRLASLQYRMNVIGAQRPIFFAGCGAQRPIFLTGNGAKRQDTQIRNRTLGAKRRHTQIRNTTLGAKRRDTQIRNMTLSSTQIRWNIRNSTLGDIGCFFATDFPCIYFVFSSFVLEATAIYSFKRKANCHGRTNRRT